MTACRTGSGTRTRGRGAGRGGPRCRRVSRLMRHHYNRCRAARVPGSRSGDRLWAVRGAVRGGVTRGARAFGFRDWFGRRVWRGVRLHAVAGCNRISRLNRRRSAARFRHQRRATDHGVVTPTPSLTAHAGGRPRPPRAAQIIRFFAAQRVSSLRFESWSLRRTLETWVSTVLTERWRRPAISL